MHRPRSATLLLLAAPLFATNAAHAGLTLEVSSTCVDSLGGVAEIDPASVGGSSHCNFTSSNAEHTASGSAYTTIRVGPRTVGIDTKATASLMRVHDYMPATTIAQAAGRATLVDRFETVATDAEGRPLSSGYMDINVLASGVVSLSGSGAGLSGVSSSQLRYRFELVPGDEVEGRVSIDYAASEAADAWLTQRWFWEAGVPTSLTLEVETFASAFMTGTGSAEAHVDFGNSLDWIGVTNVTDADGVPVASFRMVSADTGIDWGAYQPPVPEPATWGMLAAGLGLVGWAARRRNALAAREPAR
jgi:hypothetical protein